jgi:hypothetical protein
MSGEDFDMSEAECQPSIRRTVATYTIHLCKNGVEFQSLANVAERLPTPRSWRNDRTGKWLVRGVIKLTRTEHFVDVECLGR